MASYKVTCATKIHAHRHITQIGSGVLRWTVAQARDAIDAGDVFYTVSPSTKNAIVRKWTCQCGVLSLRTDADAAPDNNLDNITSCS